MRREGQAVPLVLVAAVLLKLGLSHLHLLYVKPAMRPWLVAAGAVVAVLAVARYFVVPADDDDDDEAYETDGAGDHDQHGGHDGADGHDAHHHHDAHAGSWLHCLLALPFVVVILVNPRPLGAYMAAREAPRVPSPRSSSGIDYPPLPPPVDGAHELTLTQFTERALYDTEQQMEGERVRLTGFVTPAPDGGEGFLLTRFALACCAGDARPIQVAVPGPVPGRTAPPPADTWLVVEGTWRPDPSVRRSGREADIPVLVAEDFRQTPQPTDPYES